MSDSVTSPPSSPGSLREAVLAGPGAGVRTGAGVGPLAVVATPEAVRAAVAAAGHADARRADLSAEVTAVLVLGVCLFGEGCDAVIGRLWPYLGAFNPALALRGGPVTAAALSQARGRLPAAVMREVFEAGARADPTPAETPGLRVFGMVATATDGTVFDLAAAEAVAERFATPAGGRSPQARVVTEVACGTRRVRVAAVDSSGVSEQALWDRTAGRLAPDTINFADRGFFSMHRWTVASATGAHLVWRVKNGHRSLPATVLETLPDGSQLVRLRESEAMLAARRKKTGDPAAPRLPDTVARLVEFWVTATDDAGKSKTSRYRVLTTLLDHEAHPAVEIAEAYAERWQVELAYKTIKSTLRGAGRRLRGQSAELAEQEVWGLLAVYNALVDQAVAAAADLGVDPDEISFTVVLRAARDHVAAHRPCTNCGHRPDRADLTAEIAAAPRNRPDRQRTGPRTKKERKTQHTRNVSYTIEITESNLPKAA